MQPYASHNFCVYLEGIEYAGIMEEVEIEIKTKATSRKKPYQNR